MKTTKLIPWLAMAALLLSVCGASHQDKAHAVAVAVASETESIESLTAEPAQSAADREDEMRISLKIGESVFTVRLEANETAAAFKGMLPMSITMSELHGNEKYVYLENALPTNNAVPDEIEAGDIMLFGSDCLVVFYESFTTTYSYTPIGHITDTDELKNVLDNSSIFTEWNQE